jgi:SCY1-like protein 1
LGKNALRKLRTTRHPDVIKFMDAVETDSTIHIMTERVRPLSTVLSTWSSKGDREKEDWLLWGLHRISVRCCLSRGSSCAYTAQVALAFVNDSCSSTHGNLRVNSIFISPSGEWKLGGFEVLSNPKDETAVLYVRSA